MLRHYSLLPESVSYLHHTSLCDVRLNCGTDHKESKEEHGASGSGDGATGGPEHEWKEHVRYFQHDMWSSGHPFHYLEAIGWVCYWLHCSHALMNSHFDSHFPCLAGLVCCPWKIWRSFYGLGALAEKMHVPLTLNRSPGVHLDPTQVWWQFISVHQLAAPRHLR